MAYGNPEDVVAAHLYETIEVSWAVKECGLGSFRIYPPEYDEEGRPLGNTKIDDEYIGKEAIKAILCKMIDEAEII